MRQAIEIGDPVWVNAIAAAQGEQRLAAAHRVHAASVGKILLSRRVGGYGPGLIRARHSQALASVQIVGRVKPVDRRQLGNARAMGARNGIEGLTWLDNDGAAVLIVCRRLILRRLIFGRLVGWRLLRGLYLVVDRRFVSCLRRVGIAAGGSRRGGA